MRDVKRIAALGTALLIALSGCSTPSSQTGEEEEIPALLEPVAVKLDMEQVKREDLYTIESFDGAVVPYCEELSFTIDGEIEQVFVTMGERVKRGQVLAQLDETELLESIGDLEEELAYLQEHSGYVLREMEYDIKIADMEYQRMEHRSDNDYVDKLLKQNEIEQLKLALQQEKEAQELELQQKQALLEEHKAKVGHNLITSPFDGRVIYMDKNLMPHQTAGAYDVMFYVVDESRMVISSKFITEAKLTSAYRIYGLIDGKEYDLTPVPYDMRDYVTAALSGKDMKSRFTVNIPDESIENGKYASVCVITGFRENTLTIPTNALYRGGGSSYVYCIEDGVQVRREVKVGAMSVPRVEILEGLQEGETVYVKE